MHPMYVFTPDKIDDDFVSTKNESFSAHLKTDTKMDRESDNPENSQIPLQNNSSEEDYILVEESYKIKIEYDDIMINEKKINPIVNLRIGSLVGSNRRNAANVIKKDQNTECQEKLYEKKLGTCEKLFVNLLQENLQELQKQKLCHNEQRSASDPFIRNWKSLLEKRFDMHTDTTLFKCSFCKFRSKYFESTERHVKSVHEMGFEMVGCDKCPYKTKVKANLKRHKVLHQSLDEVPIYKCDVCPFTTVHKASIPTHKLTHQAPDKNHMIQCSMCPYQGKTKHHLRAHFQIHKKTKIHKCTSCSYQTRNIANYKRHCLTHKPKEEKTFFYCNTCDYRAVVKDLLSSHCRNVHSNPQKSSLFACDECEFQTKYKYSLKNHIRCKHSAKKFYKCTECSFQTIHIVSIKNHETRHKSEEETQIYKCPDCPYKAKLMCYLRRHALTHKPPDKVLMYTCDVCSFQTKHKYSLTLHMQTHLVPDESDMRQCRFCSFKTKSETLLRLHMKVHQTLKEGIVHKCEKCPYHSRNTGNLKRHIQQIHKKRAQAQIFFQCSKCEYQSTRKGWLKTHFDNVHMIN